MLLWSLEFEILLTNRRSAIGKFQIVIATWLQDLRCLELRHRYQLILAQWQQMASCEWFAVWQSAKKNNWKHSAMNQGYVSHCFARVSKTCFFTKKKRCLSTYHDVYVLIVRCQSTVNRAYFSNCFERGCSHRIHGPWILYHITDNKICSFNVQIIWKVFGKFPII